MSDDTAAPVQPPSSSMEAEPAPGKVPSSHPASGLARIFFLCLVVSLVTAAATVYVYDQRFAQKVVAVDLKGFLKQQKEDFLDGKLTKEDVDRNMDRLESFVDQIPANHSVILGDVVVRNVEVLKP